MRKTLCDDGSEGKELVEEDIDDLCYPCGVVMTSHNLSKEQFIEKQTDPEFHDATLTGRLEVLKGSSEFRDRDVVSRCRVGLRTSHSVALVNVSVFSTTFEHTPETMKQPVIDHLDQEFKPTKSCMLQPIGIPAKVPRMEAECFFEQDGCNKKIMHTGCAYFESKHSFIQKEERQEAQIAKLITQDITFAYIPLLAQITLEIVDVAEAHPSCPRWVSDDAQPPGLTDDIHSRLDFCNQNNFYFAMFYIIFYYPHPPFGR